MIEASDSVDFFWMRRRPCASKTVMRLDLARLPNDPVLLQRVVRDLAEVLEGQEAELAATKARLADRDAELEKLQLFLAALKRLKFGRSSEKHYPDQLTLSLEAIEEQIAALSAESEPPPPATAPEKKPSRRPLPGHLPREERRHEPAGCACPACGGQLHVIGEDVSEVLDYVPARFKVIRHVRPRFACRACESIHQAPMPSLPIERGRPGPGLLAHVLIAKFCDHLPLYRQSLIYARAGVDLDRSTLADWVGRASWLLQPLGKRLADQVFAAAKIHADDTPVPVLDPGRGRTKTGRLWVYVRDDRPSGDASPPAAVFFYSPDRIRANGQPTIWPASRASCRPTPMPGSTSYTASGSSRWPVGRTRGARFSTSTTVRSRRSRRKRWRTSVSCIGSRRRSVAGAQTPGAMSDRERLSPCSRR